MTSKFNQKAAIRGSNTEEFSKTNSIIELAKQYGIDSKGIPNTSIPEFLRSVGRNDLSKAYEFIRRGLKEV